MSDLPTADQLEDVFHAALKDGDIEGVEAAIRVMVTVDPKRAVALYDDLQTALAIAKVVRP